MAAVNQRGVTVVVRRRSDRSVGIEEKIDIGSDGGERRPVDYFSSILSKRDMETSSAVVNWKNGVLALTVARH
jgi:hypothetical protein